MTTALVRAWCLAGCSFALCAMLDGCSKPTSNPEKESSGQTVAPSAVTDLPKHIWRVEQPASQFAGTIYIFVPDGTLLETSCKETYRIAKWSADPNSPGAIQVVEDGQPAFTGTIADAAQVGMRLQRRLRHGETDELKLSAVAGEFVCPDLR
jgi:hypothetical protein